VSANSQTRPTRPAWDGSRKVNRRELERAAQAALVTLVMFRRGQKPSDNGEAAILELERVLKPIPA
jgi:hypothetical protein